MILEKEITIYSLSINAVGGGAGGEGCRLSNNKWLPMPSTFTITFTTTFALLLQHIV